MADHRRSSMLSDFFASIADRGRSLIDLGGARARADTAEGLCSLCDELITSVGEASGIAMATEILDGFGTLDEDEKTLFFERLTDAFGPDQDRLAEAAERYVAVRSNEHALALTEAAEPRRRELFRRLNQAPGATLKLVRLRESLLQRLRASPALRPVDEDLAHLFRHWFNRGFLELRRIDWHTSAAVLEKVIAYEAVHAIGDWDDLRARIAPSDRRLYGFFHPRLVDEPLIFVEVALVADMAAEIRSILDIEREILKPEKAKAAIFYSISNCQKGLKGISFGNFLIKQVVDELQHELLNLSQFATLSPLPGFARWLAENTTPAMLDEIEALQLLDKDGWWEDAGSAAALEKAVMPLAAHYLLAVKASDGKPLDPVARFHLGNGARLERINWLADRSTSGLRQAHGLMVNYVYQAGEIEQNHEAFVNEGHVATTRAITRLARSYRPPVTSRSEAVT